MHPVSAPAQALLTVLGDSLLPVLDAVEPAVEEFAAALGDLVEAASPLLPAAAGVAAGLLLALTPSSGRRPTYWPTPHPNSGASRRR